jgi:hypothetical protein
MIASNPYFQSGPLRTVLLSGIVAMLGSCAQPVSPPAQVVVPATENRELMNTWAFQTDYRIEHYLDESVKLQVLSEKSRVAKLRELSEDPHRGSEVFVLCRMLFEARAGSKFRGPMIGSVEFIGSSRSDVEWPDYGHWPLDPIEICKGAPILVAKSYFLAGAAETPKHYLSYCIANCCWSSAKSKRMSEAERVQIVETFLASQPHLSEEDRAWMREKSR